MKLMKLATLLVFLVHSTYAGFLCRVGNEGVLSAQPCNTFCRHRCYYKFNQRVYNFDGTDDQLQNSDGLPSSSFVSQYAVAVTGFLDVRRQFFHQHFFRSFLRRNVEEENEEDETQEEYTEESENQLDTNTLSANPQFASWSFLRKITAFSNARFMRHKVDARGLYLSIDVSIQNGRQQDAYEYTCVKGAHLQNPNTVQHVINSYRNNLNNRRVFHLAPTLLNYFEQDIKVLSAFNKECKNIAGTSFVDRYKNFINQKFSSFNYQRNWFLAGQYRESFVYFEHLGRVLVMYSNFPVCRCSSLRYFTRGFGATNGWTDVERASAANLINQRCTEELFKKFGTSATLIREY